MCDLLRSTVRSTHNHYVIQLILLLRAAVFSFYDMGISHVGGCDSLGEREYRIVYVMCEWDLFVCAVASQTVYDTSTLIQGLSDL